MSSNSEKLKRKKFEAFFISYYPKVRAYALKLLKNEADAEDITQDIFVQLWDLPHVWTETEKYNAYIFTMVKNHIFNYFKRAEVARKYESYLANILSESVDSDIYDQISVKELKNIATDIIGSMPPKRREIFLLSRNKGLTNQDIADKMGLSIRTVEHHLYLALASLKKGIFSILLISLIFFK